MTETRKAFHDELRELSEDVVRMGALATEAVQAGTNAFLDADLKAAEKVVTEDRKLDDLMASIEQRTYLLLARQQPMAVDLRMLVTILRIIHELERVGDYMVNVAKTTRRLYPYELPPKVRGIIHQMRQQAVAQTKVAVEAFAERDPARAAALADMDDVMDDLQKDLFRTIFASEAKDEAAIQRAVQIALVGRYFERVADHAVNTGERVEFMVTGENHAEPHGSPDET
jgi:phosphate transport system protein